MTPEFFIYVGIDKHFIGHSENIAYDNFNLRDGSFKKEIFNYKDLLELKAGLDYQSKSIPHNPGDIIRKKKKIFLFILGGNDNDRYPRFNGIFTYVSFGT